MTARSTPARTLTTTFSTIVGRPGPPALRVYAYWGTRFGHSWQRSTAASILGPAIYMIALGELLGQLIVDPDAAPFGSAGYVGFVAPGIVAVAALMTATTESGFPTYTALHSARTYEAMVATPVRVRDLVVGQLLWTATRVAMIAAALVLLLLAVLGDAAGPTVPLVVPATALTALAFAGGIMALAAVVEHDSAIMGWMRFGVTPMLLFSGILYPIGQLPPALQTLARATPLWHGAELNRSLALGDIPLGPTLVHVVYLSAAAVIGALVAIRVLGRRLNH